MRNPLEELYYDALDSDQQDAADALGYGRHTWTCCVNHYEWHHWGHMGNWYPEAVEAYEALGWTKKRWNRDQDYPASAYKVWCRDVTGEVEGVCLRRDEMAALQSLCYTPSSYRWESLARPLFGTYEVPPHCAAGVRTRAKAFDEGWMVEAEDELQLEEQGEFSNDAAYAAGGEGGGVSADALDLGLDLGEPKKDLFLAPEAEATATTTVATAPATAPAPTAVSVQALATASAAPGGRGRRGTLLSLLAVAAAAAVAAA
jgi:hypothetical protein